MSDIVFELAYPYEWEGKTISEITLKRPNAGVLERIERDTTDKGRVASQIVLVAALSGLTVGCVRKMDVQDLIKADEKAADFFPKPPSEGTE